MIERYNYGKPIAFLRRKYAAEPEAENFRRILVKIPLAGSPPGMTGLFGIEPDDKNYDLPSVSAMTITPQPFEYNVSASLNHTTLDYEGVLRKGLKAIAETMPCSGTVLRPAEKFHRHGQHTASTHLTRHLVKN